MTKLAFLTTEYLREFTENTLAEIGFHLDYQVYLYKSFRDIVEVYDALPDEVRGVVTSGRFGSGVIRHSRPESTRFITSFDADDAGMYWLLIQLMRNPSFNPKRVYVDFFDVMGVNLSSYMFYRTMAPLPDLLTDFMRDMTHSRLQDIEEHVLERHVKLWREGRTDISVTRFASLAQRIEDAGVPVRFVYPSLHHVKDVCFKVLQELQIKQLQENLLAVIEVTINSVTLGTEEANRRLRALEAALNQFKSQNLYDFMLSPIPFGFEIFTSRKVVDELTDNGKGCRLQGFFKNSLDIPVFIGYGVGNDIYRARMHALVANREAKLVHEGGSCFINDEDELISNLGSLAQVKVKRNTHTALKQASKKSGLATLTIQKIIAVAREMENGCLTSLDVANKLGITRRSANRFMSALLKTRIAKISTQKSANTRGRPERVFKIVFDS